MTPTAALRAEPLALPSQEPSTPSLREFVESSGLQSLVVGTSKYPNAKVTILLLSAATGRPALAVKAPTTDAAARAIARESVVLTELRGSLSEGLLRTIPRVVEVVEFEGRRAIVMTAVHGAPMTTSYVRWRHTASPARVAQDFAAVEAWLVDFQRETAREPGPMDLDAGVSARLRRRFADDPLLGEDVDRLAQVHERLRRITAARAAVHGDLWFGNLLVSGGRASGVVDWEAGATSGAGIRDLARFALMYALYLDRRTRQGHRVRGHVGLRADRWGAGVEFALDGRGWFPELFRRFLQDGLARLGASPTSWRDAALAGVAEVAAFTDEPEFARRHLELFRRISSQQPSRKDLQ